MRRGVALLLWLAAAPVFADHPGADRLDQVMAAKEPAFEATDTRDMPDLEVVTADGQELELDEFADQVIVLSFLPEECAEPCAAQQAALGKLGRNLDATPMRDMVTFVTVRPEQSLPAEADAANRLQVSPRAGSVPDLAAIFAPLSRREDGQPLVHVIDRATRHAAIFHGSAFDPLNMTLYINGLTNSPPSEPGFVDRVLGFFWERT
jgi:protein SCO1/2